MKKNLFFVVIFLITIVTLRAQNVPTGVVNSSVPTPATIPYSCDFENPTENALWELSNATNTNKWHIGTPSNLNLPISGGCLYISNDNGLTNSYTITTAGVVVATRYIEFSGANEYTLSFDLYIGGESIHDYIKVFVVPVDTNYVGVAGSTYPYYSVAAFNLNQYMVGNAGVPYFNGYNGTTAVAGSYPRQVIIPNQGPAGTVKKLIILWKNDTSVGTQPPASIDNISIVENNCAMPSAVLTSNITTNSIDLAWTENGTASAWNVQYKLASSSTWITVPAGSNPFTLTNLASSSTYHLRIQADCGSEQSIWTNPITFTTACGTITQFPWFEGFETPTTWPAAVAPGNALAPNCWLHFNTGLTTGLWRRTSTASWLRTGTGAAQVWTGGATSVNNDYLITPAFTFTGNERIRFWAKGDGTSVNRLKVRIYDISTTGQNISSIADTSLFVTLMPNTILSNTTWNEFEIFLNNFVGDYRIAFVVDTVGGTYINVDDITIDAIPTCMRPTAIAVSNITSSSVDISWTTPSPTQTLWYLYFKPTLSSVWDSVLVSTTTYTFSNLNSNTSYQFYLKTDCGTELSEATNVTTFQTACGITSQFPWVEGFEIPTTWPAAVAPGNALAPNCWLNFNTGLTTGLWRRSTSATYIRSGTGGAQVWTGGATSLNNDYLITPIFTFSGNERIRFWAKGDGTSVNRLKVRIYDISTTGQNISSIADTSLFVTIMPNTILNNTTWNEYEISLSNFVGDYRIAFVVDTVQGTYINIDDIVIDAIPACPDISQLTLLSSTSSTVTLNWTWTTNANLGFEISYGNVNSGFDPSTGTIINVPDGTTLPYVVSNLTPGQFYSFAVRQACNGAWSNIVVTNTDGLPAVLPYSCDFSDINEQASWKISNGNAVNKFFIGTPSNVVAPISGANLFISNDYGVTNTYTITTTSTAIASRLIEFDGSGGYSLNFDLYIGGESSLDYIKVFLTDPDTTFVGGNTTPYYAASAYNGNNQLLTNYNNTAPYFNGYNGSSVIAGSYPRQIILPYQGPAGTVKRLIILWRNDGSVGTQPPAAIDNIVLQALTCPIPNTIATSNLTSTSTDITWVDPSGTATEWIFRWKPVSSTTWDIASSFATTYSLTNLTINTPYNVSIATVCGSDTSVYSNFNFTTPCADIMIPYTQNFDAATGFPTCWTRKAGATNPTSSTINFSSPNSLYFYASSTFQYAATPPIDINVATNTLQVSFKLYRTTASYTGVKVGVMTDPNNMATFQQIGNTISTSALSTWEDKTVFLSSYTGTGRYIALLCDGPTAVNSFYVDNFEITVIPSCPRPTQLTATNILANSVDLNWLENGSATTWDIEYGPTGFVQGQGTMVSGVTTMPYPLSGLNPQTTYQFYVKSICGVGDESLWSTVKSFTTACVPVTTVPYTENFDTYGTTAGTFPTCWFRPILNTTTPYPSIVTAFSVSSPASLRFQSASATQPTYAVTPQLDVDINTLMVSFKLKAESITSSGTMHVGVMSDPSIESTFELVQIITPTNTNFNDYEISFANTTLTGTGKYIAFKHVTVSSVYYYWLDNVEVDLIPTCVKPTNVTFSLVTTNSATASWVPSLSALSYEVVYGLSGLDPTTATPIAVTDTFYDMTSLTATTLYHFYVRSVCAGGEYSDWTSLSTFSTVALAPVPYSEPFTTTVTPVGYNLTSFFVGAPAGIPGNPANNIYVNLYSSIPTANFSTINIGPLGPNYSLNFDYSIALWSAGGQVPAGSGDFVVAISTDWGTTYTNVATVVNNGVVGYQPYTLSLSAYENQIIKIKITGNWISSDYYLGFDNIYVGPSITCPAPSSLTASNPTTTSINLAWTENGTATSWEVQYGAPGFTLGTGTTVVANVNNPYTVSSLAPSTTYDFYVRAVCGAGDLSMWSQKVTLTTACLAQSLPLTEGFEGSTNIPTCWSTTTTAANYTVVSSGSNPTCSPYAGTNMLHYNSFSISSGNHAVLYSPLLNVTGAPILVSYWQYRDPGYTTYLTEGVEVLYNTTASTTGATSLGFTSRYFATAGWYNITYTIPAGLTGNAYIMFKTNSLFGNNQFIDDISFTYTTISCPIPTNLAVSAINSTNATATWTAGGTETQWEVAYKATAASTWMTTIVNTSPSYLIPSLTAGTAYDVKVRAICAAGDTSAYTAIVNFTTTTVSCNTPTNLAAGTITNTGATITWSAGGTETSWEVDYKLATATTWTTVTATSASKVLTGLATCSNYNVRVRAVCGVGIFSSYTTVVNFSTLSQVPTNLQVTNITDQGALVTWTAGGTETSWQIEYKLVSSANWASATVNGTPSYLLTGLQSNSLYEVRVKSLCSPNESVFTPTAQFTTLGMSFTITATSGPNGTITPSGVITLNAGANQTFTFEPHNTYHIDVITIDGIAHTSTPTSYTFTNVMGNHTIHVDFAQGIEENALAQLVELFPNPTSSIIELRLKSDNLHVKECKVFDMYGKLMKVIPIHAETTSIDVTDFASGVYFVRMESEKGTISKKFVKK